LIKEGGEHLGEAFSLKGIITMNMGKPEEGLELAKLGCKNNIKSGFSWHILGLIYKNSSNFEEAVKSFRTSLRNDKDNMAVMKELANCLTQIQEYKSNVELRKQIAYSKPSYMLNWIGLWSGFLLSGSHSQGVFNIIDSVFDSKTDVYHNELLASFNENNPGSVDSVPSSTYSAISNLSLYHLV
jgi:tetratricopeptide (TPR) repeat protein